MVYLLSILASGVTDSLGLPVSNGSVTFYDAGTTTKTTVYADPSMDTEVSNPATLSAAGTLVAFATARVRMVIKDSSGVITQVLDNVGIGAKDISAEDLADQSVTTNSLVDNSVSATELSSSVASTRTFRNGQLTLAKFSSINDISSNTSGTFAPGSNLSAQDVTNLAVAITTTGRPVLVTLLADGTANASLMKAEAGVAIGGANCYLVLDGTTIATYSLGNTNQIVFPTSGIYYGHQPAAGLHNYKVQADTNGSDALNNAKLFVREL